MRISSLCFLLVLIFIPNSVYAWDWGNSNNLFIKKKLNDRWAIVTRSLFTSKNDMHDIFLGVADVGLRYALTDEVSVDTVYRGVWFKLSTGWVYENRPLVNINLTETWKGYMWNHRSRFEFRLYDYDKKDDVRYRSEFRVITPFKLTRWDLVPYVEEEFFYSFNENEINMNWLSSGLRYKVNKNTTVKLGYRWQTQKLSGQWVNRNVLVTGVLFFF
jgi:hypothetical protein